MFFFCIYPFTFLNFLIAIAEVTSNAELKGRVVRNNFDGERYIEFTSADVDVTLKDYGLQIDELFSDKDLSKYRFIARPTLSLREIRKNCNNERRDGKKEIRRVIAIN